MLILNSQKILFCIKFFVFSHKNIVFFPLCSENSGFSLCVSYIIIAVCIYLADKFTISPRREYSLLPPEEPHTPVKQLPVVIPIKAFTLYFSFNSFTIKFALYTALTGSSEVLKGGNPQQHSITEPLSSIKNLFKLPLVLYTQTCTVETTFWIFSRPLGVSVSFKSTDNCMNIIVKSLTSLHQFSCSISK